MMTLLVNLKKTMFKVITVEQKEIYKITQSKSKQLSVLCSQKQLQTLQFPNYKSILSTQESKLLHRLTCFKTEIANNLIVLICRRIHDQYQNHRPRYQLYGYRYCARWISLHKYSKFNTESTCTFTQHRRYSVIIFWIN